MSHFRRIPAKVGFAMVLFFALAFDAQSLNAPVLSTPTNGATGQDTTLTLGWTTVSGASSYTLQLSQTSTFSTILVNQGSSPPRSLFQAWCLIPHITGVQMLPTPAGRAHGRVSGASQHLSFPLCQLFPYHPTVQVISRYL